MAALERIVPNTESADAGLKVLQYILPTEPIRAPATLDPNLIRRRKELWMSVPIETSKTARVLAMAAREDAKRLDFVSYALIFLLIVIAAEMIVAALVW